MKRMIAMSLALALTMSLCACGASSTQSGDKSESIAAKNEKVTDEVYAEDFFAGCGLKFHGDIPLR